MQGRIALAFLVAGLGLAAAAPPATAAPAGKQPCYKRVIADWSRDGVINGHYSVKCLRTAIKKTPEDLRDYSGIVDDINAAIIGAGGTPGGKGKNGGGPGGGNGSGGPGGGGGAVPGTNPKSVAAAKKAVPAAGTPASAPGHDGSFPLPLIILGAVVLAGALAAAAPAGINRLRTRFPRLRPSTGSARPPA